MKSRIDRKIIGSILRKENRNQNTTSEIYRRDKTDLERHSATGCTCNYEGNRLYLLVDICCSSICIQSSFPLAMEIDRLCHLFKNGITDDDDRELLGNSLFYCCCGMDPTPLIAFGSQYPLYVYVDIEGFDVNTTMLFQRLCKAGYSLVKSRELPKSGPLRDVKNAVLAHFKAPKSNTISQSISNDCIYLLYAQSGASKAYHSIYQDTDKGGHLNCILAKCLCNIRCEFFNEIDGVSMDQLARRTEYVFGHNYSDKYKCIAEYDYWGDYDSHMSKIPLYHRKYWYWG